MDYDLIVIGGSTAGMNTTPGKLAIPVCTARRVCRL
jgi:hypothetical protein